MCYYWLFSTFSGPDHTHYMIRAPGEPIDEIEEHWSDDSLSLLECYFHHPSESFLDTQNTIHCFDDLSYTEYYSAFCLARYDPTKAGYLNYFTEHHAHQSTSVRMHVIFRSFAAPHLARICSVQPSEGKRFYLCALLQHRPARCFRDMQTVDGGVHDSHQLTAAALGLFANNNEAELALLEVIAALRTPHQLHVLFAHLLVNDCIATPLVLWDTLQLGMNHALYEVSTYLEEHGKSLQDYGLPEPTQHIFDTIVQAALSKTPLLAFINGKAGQGKTFLVNTIYDYLQGHGNIVLPTTTSGYAAQLYPGGRTTHSTFKVPVNNKNELLKSPITTQSLRGDLINQVRAIMWDEAPMANKAVLACMEEVLRTVSKCPKLPFSGKVFVTSGGFAL
ncbi:uncharacterized protein PHACADRAFT_30677 [Phanerochaete carnosa HHB-10118-sp]|uniref:ATP-dependent DNA helicase n=1 Tax=Phanerochaete carnosa (strain HHB-10118-sp) TaxID=650164 RepID=K5W464_PHACS|nr:uncharacterized protein PHACADRAFT_30677 [Phanerochaete carnosa HHB-10118-sp]EKM53739.1 hypothetical protein PHACADRAFT_30677 [Phanerochaete carnosa HHB-10118-sp]